MDLFYGVDYHSHLGTRRGGMATHGADGFCRSIHNIENSPFRTKFERDVEELTGNLGIGCISDYEPQPLLIQSHLGSFAITTVGKINNADELLNKIYENGHSHFQEMSGGQINATELVAALICKQDSFENGIRYAQEAIDGSLTLLIMTKDGIYAARDIYGRTPLVIGHRCKRIRSRRDCIHHPRECGNARSASQENENLFFPVGLLWLSDFQLRRRKRRRNAL